MQNICYRCGRPIEGQIAFCAACGAPQIRVSTPEQPLNVPEKQQDLPPVSPERPLPPSGGLALSTGIAWKDFIRAATPLAALTGILTVPLAPLGLFVLLPANLIWAISRYLRRRPMALSSGQGARLGAMMGALSFGFFLVCFLAAVSLNLAKYHELIVAWVTETTSRNSDPQMQQMLQRFAAPDGMLPFTALFLATFLITFLIIGMGSGALAVALGRARNRL